MGDLEERLLKAIRKQGFVRAGDRIAVAVSGGADSVALLLLLIELRGDIGIVLSVAHVNHKLRGAESEADEQFVRELADEHKLEFLNHTATIEMGSHSGIEGEARRLRYEFFCQLMRAGRATKIATAHTLDDQAETVLLRVFRGTGIRGLAGIHPVLVMEKDGVAYGEVVRPLLAFRRAELREYLSARGQGWREDSSNQDEAFLRNRLRRRLLPIIAEEFGDSTMEHLAELAEIARAEEELNIQYPVPSTQLSEEVLAVDWLLALPLAAQRRVLRAWMESNVPRARVSFRLIESTLELARKRARREIDVPSGADDTDPNQSGESSRLLNDNRWIIRIGPRELIVEEVSDDLPDYQYTLCVPGEVFVPALRLTISAEIAEVEEVPESSRSGLLDAAQVGGKLIVRNWRAGDRYWPAHTKGEKKVKELLSQRHIRGPEKKLWPVVESGGEIVWVRGFVVPEKLRAHTRRGIWIQDAPIVH